MGSVSMVVESVAEKESFSEKADATKSPDADYGLRDGFDPSKYEFYNPPQHINRNLRSPRSNSKDPDCTKTQLDAALPIGSPEDLTTKLSFLSPIQEQEDDTYSTSKLQSIDFASRFDSSPRKETRFGMPEDFIPHPTNAGQICIETMDESLFSIEHVKQVLEDRDLNVEFQTFLGACQPNAMPHFARFSILTKALRSIRYAEAIVSGLNSVRDAPVTSKIGNFTMPWVIQDKIESTLNIFVDKYFRAFIADKYARLSERALADRVIGNYNSKIAEIVPGLAEVFVLSDPTRHDNPVVFTSDDFQRMTGYERKEFIGKNCRILGGPRTSRPGIDRIREALNHEREICEVLVNYRHDGKAFMNLITCVPLRDQLGRLRYYLGAQVDITALVCGCVGLPTLKSVQQSKDLGYENLSHALRDDTQDAFEKLCVAFNKQEVDHLCALNEEQSNGAKGIEGNAASKRDRTKSPFDDIATNRDSFTHTETDKTLPASFGFYQHYLLVRPHPSLRILFTSPELQALGIAQKPLMSLVGGSAQVRDHLSHALWVGRKVTAKAKWLAHTEPKPGLSWIHCTPLLGTKDALGVWMVIIVKAEDEIGENVSTAYSEGAPTNWHRPSHDPAAVPWDTQALGRIPSRTSEHKIARESDLRGKVEAAVDRRPHINSISQNKAENGIETKAFTGQSSEIFGDGMWTESNLTLDEHTLDISANKSASQNSSELRGSLPTQPNVTIAGLRFLNDSGSRKPPIKLPSSGLNRESDQNEKPTRTTYKSLSPYGVLFRE